MRKGKKGEAAVVAVELTDFSVFYSQDSIANADSLGRYRRGHQYLMECCRMKTIAAQEIKKRGISAVDEAIKEGPVHVIKNDALAKCHSRSDSERESRF